MIYEKPNVAALGQAMRVILNLTKPGPHVDSYIPTTDTRGGIVVSPPPAYELDE